MSARELSTEDKLAVEHYVQSIMQNKRTQGLAKLHHMRNCEMQILQMLSNGETAKDIGPAVHLSHRTVEAKIILMRERFQCKTATQLVAYAIRNKIIE